MKKRKKKEKRKEREKERKLSPWGNSREIFLRIMDIYPGRKKKGAKECGVSRAKRSKKKKNFRAQLTFILWFVKNRNSIFFSSCFSTFFLLLLHHCALAQHQREHIHRHTQGKKLTSQLNSKKSKKVTNCNDSICLEDKTHTINRDECDQPRLKLFVVLTKKVSKKFQFLDIIKKNPNNPSLTLCYPPSVVDIWVAPFYTNRSSESCRFRYSIKSLL